MKVLAIIAGIIVIIGGLMIVFAKQLAILYEGPHYTMSDLGFIVSGMMIAGVGIILLIISLILRFTRK